jgi:hypothetical protein
MKPCPPCGSGRVNLWTYGAACEGLRSGWSKEKTRAYLEENTTHSGAEADEEIERAVNRVFSIDGIPAAEQWPARNDALRRRIFSSRVSVATLSKLSPVTDVPQVDLLERLFPGNPLIWAAHSGNRHEAAHQPYKGVLLRIDFDLLITPQLNAAED